jgi:hypothetical protein
MTTCKTSLLVSLLAKPQELPISQLAMHVNLFHLVITDRQGPAAKLFSGRNTLLSCGAAPLIKLTIHSS